MSVRVTVYCDESGNDGPNYLNKESPFYVLGGWIVPEESIVDAAVAIEQLRKSEFHQSTTELKFSLFGRNDRRRKALVKIIERLQGLKLTPVYLVAEKRYCVAAKIVETFLDPWYNKLAKNGMTWNTDVKQEIANTLYERLPDSTLERFANAYRYPTQVDLAVALTEIEADCCRHVNPELANFFHGSLPALDEIAAAEINANSTWGKGSGTLNLPCLITFIMMIEQMGRAGLISTNKIVHDEQGPYEDTYKAAFLHCKNRNDFWVTLPGSELGQGSVLTVESFETQRSDQQPLVQAADLLAGTVNSLCISLIAGNALSNHELEVSRYVLTPMLFREHKIAFPICSDHMLTRIGYAVRNSFPEFSSEVDTLPYKKADTRGLPLLPIQRSKTAAEPDHPKFKMDLPLFGIVCTRNDRLIAIVNSDSGELIGKDKPLVPFFTTKESAEAFLADMQPQWDEPHRVGEFNVPDVNQLLMQLDKMSAIADIVLMNSHGLIKIREFIQGLRSAFERVFAAFATGAANVLFEKHTVDGVEFVSLLLSSGEYGAMKADGGNISIADTRAEALNSAVALVSNSIE